jgi:para-aminobenzoate synthetase component II
MFLVIDKFDSFVFNLSSCFEDLGKEVIVVKEDRLSIDVLNFSEIDGIVLSPGSGRPCEKSASWKAVNEFKGKIPILGVCLGHQTICSVFGGDLVNGNVPMHGKITPIEHNGKGIFLGIPDLIRVTRYNSLSVDPSTVPACINIDALDDKGDIMAISHKDYPIYGVQFHPESFMTESGTDIIYNFIRITKEWKAC